MTISISTFAKKGGIGKTTLAYNFAGYLASLGKRVVLVDADHQNSISQVALGAAEVEAMPKRNTVATLFDEKAEPDLTEVLQPTKDPNILIAPANDTLQAYAFPDPRQRGQLQFVYRELVEELRGEVDFIIFDTPPDCANLLSWNCLMASDYAFTVLQMEPMSAQSIQGTYRKIQEAIQHGNPKLQFLGYIINNIDGRKTIHKGYEKETRQLYGSQVFESVVRTATTFAEAQHTHQHVYQYAPKSNAAKMSTKLFDELLGRVNQFVAGRAA